MTDGTYTSGRPRIGFLHPGRKRLARERLWLYELHSFGRRDRHTTPPSTPVNLSANIISPSQIALSWGTSTDNVAVVGYHVFRNDKQIATTTSASFADTTVVPGVQYTYTVSALDAAGNTSAQSSPVSAETSSASDITPPSVPANLKCSNVTSTTLTLTWSASTDNVAVAGYRIFRNGTQVGTTGTTSYADSGLVASTSYTYTVDAYDGDREIPPLNPRSLSPRRRLPLSRRHLLSRQPTIKSQAGRTPRLPSTLPHRLGIRLWFMSSGITPAVSP